MENVWMITTFLLIFLLSILIVYHLYYVININHITRQLKEIINNIDTNEILTVVANQKDISDLINILNNLIRQTRQSNSKMKKLTKRFRESIINMSHDLRTPLTTASGYLQMLQTNVTEKEKAEYLKIVLERQNMVKVLLEQLFEYVRIEAGEITYEHTCIDARRIFIDTLAMYYNDFNEKGEEPSIHLIEHPCIILGDEQGVKRIFSNIIFNALIHGEGGYCFGVTEQDGCYKFTFSNKSDFMTTEDIDMIFERFYIKDKSRSKKTTGLGLAIAKEITMQLKGRIESFYEDGVFSIVIYLPKKK